MKQVGFSVFLIGIFLFCFSCKSPSNYSGVASDRDAPDISIRNATSDEAVRAAFYSLENDLPKNMETLSSEKIKSLYSEAVNHPIAKISEENLKKYDPNGIIGFCFGRAMAVHLLARKMGLAPTSIKKFFVIGDLRSGRESEWRFHVTTLVLNENREWIAVDPIMRGPMPLRDWVKYVQRVWDSWQGSPKAKFYVVTTDAVLPDLAVFKAPEQETGEYIIEIKFDPSIQVGFKHSPEISETAYNVDLEREKKFFAAVTEDEKTRFNFLSVTINETETINFSNYFVDLLNDLTAIRVSRAATFSSELGFFDVKQNIENVNPLDLLHPEYVKYYVKKKQSSSQ